MCIPVFAAVGTALGASTATAATVGTMAALSLASAGISAHGQYQQGKATQQTARNNAQLAEAQARDAQLRGEQQVQEVNRRAASLKAAQRASLAARGVDAGYGTAADIQDQTDFFAATDSATARSNAAREAWSLRNQATGYRTQADSVNPGLTAGTSMLGAVGQVASKWYTPSSAAVVGYGDGLSQGDRRNIRGY